jgi:CDP-diacylglycerol--glycerol-3-phosphate 3-phosphatidyltransferase
MKRSDFINPPNVISFFRLAMTPFLFLFLYMEKYLNPDHDTIFFNIAAGIVFLLGALTDLADGIVARRWHYVTDIGKFLDPLADKVIVSTALILLVNLNRAPAWIALIIILREMVITGLRGLASTRGTIIAASNLGKGKTVLQDIALTGLLLHEPMDLGRGWAPAWLTFHNAGALVLYLAVFYTLYSGYDYVKKFVASETADAPGDKPASAGG